MSRYLDADSDGRPDLAGDPVKLTIWTGGFWLSTAERVLATIAATLLGILTFDGFDLRHADWSAILASAGLAGVVSLLKCVVGNATTKTGPSLVNSERVVPPEPQPVHD